ncbi:MAG: hypothetical protein IJQ89_12035 [Bacteroidales bacterium]|nr:hypothetical protein [Bacteroidales bacterium]MBQ6727284.1 hypothetical protein [Bacteroidales bacterium]
MKKTSLFIALLLTVSAMAFAQENKNVWMPHGYQGFLEMNSGFQVANGGNYTTGVSTTHGFYFNGHTYVGVGMGLDFCDIEGNSSSDLIVPFFANVNYLFLNDKNISPVVKMSLGSYVGSYHGTYGDLGFGVRFGSRRDFAVTVMVTGTFYSNLKEEQYHYDDVSGVYSTIENYKNISTVSLRFGIEW